MLMCVGLTSHLWRNAGYTRARFGNGFSGHIVNNVLSVDCVIESCWMQLTLFLIENQRENRLSATVYRFADCIMPHSTSSSWG